MKKEKKLIPGDIITNGHHMGIVMGEDSTISASANSIRYSDFNSYTDPEEEFFSAYLDMIMEFQFSLIQ